MMTLLALFALCSCICWAQVHSVVPNEESINAKEAPNIDLVHGDIRLTPEQRAELSTETSNKLKAVMRSTFAMWPNAIVPYVLDGSLGSSQRSAIYRAIAIYHAESCVRFVPRTDQRDYVLFIKDRGGSEPVMKHVPVMKEKSLDLIKFPQRCWSYIGRIGGRQKISIGGGCEWDGIVLHEMFHALGRWHEQSRPDRDNHVDIIEENIISGTEGNFEKIPSGTASTQGISYDFSSVMHYGAYDFSRNGRPTIRPRDSRISLSLLGQRNGFTASDLQHVNALYSCNSPATATWGSWGSWSQCSRTCNGGTRSRSRACIGGTSCEGSNIDTELCNTNACPVVATWGSWSSWGSCSATCGGGQTTRSRSCRNGNTCPGPSTEQDSCNTQSCPTIPPESIPGVDHLGCYSVPLFSSSIGLLEGKTSETKDNPITRTDPAGKCARAANIYGYNHFAVARGYCVTGSNVPGPYTEGGGSNRCSGGAGGYSHGYGYSMDVYRITSDFQQVASDVGVFGGVFNSTLTSISALGETTANGSQNLQSNTSIVLIALALIYTAVYYY